MTAEIGAYWTLLKIGKSVWDFCHKRLNPTRRWFCQKLRHPISIAILDGRITEEPARHPCERSWTDLKVQDWDNATREQTRINPKLIPATAIANSHHTMIINPFGDNYPEEDPCTCKTFGAIRDYINNGGIFVITCGAFWSSQDTMTSSKADWAMKQLVNGIQKTRDSLITQRLGIQITADTITRGDRCVPEIESPPFNIYQPVKSLEKFGDLLQGIASAKRFRSVIENESYIVPVVQIKDTKYYPVAIIRRGKGAIIHFGFSIQRPNDPEFKVLESNEFKIIIRFLKSAISKKFKNVPFLN
jgi:hypothetical protein